MRSETSCSGGHQGKEVTVLSPGELWVLFGVLASLLPLFLLVRTVAHVLNIPLGRRR